jgi:Rad3-related DNA helicase
MWSLHEKKGEKETKLEPLVFSNGKSQEDVVSEIKKSIDEGNKIIFVHGVCGTGKSAIALNLAKDLGKTSIVVPVKNLQKQYEQDYTNKKYLLKKNDEKLKIRVITGRQNHKCPFSKETELPELAEKNKTLEEFDEEPNELDIDDSCDNRALPCKIEIKDKNYKALIDYIRKVSESKELNPENKIDVNDFKTSREITRRSIAIACPYWSPILPVEIELNLEAKKKTYEGLSGKNFRIYQRKKGCPYYEQFLDYLHTDVLIFNSEKYKLETIMDRKPATELEIIDECDEFLDNLANAKRINLNKLFIALGNVFTNNDKTNKALIELNQIVRSLLNNPTIDSLIEEQKIVKLKETKIYDILRLFIDADLVDNSDCDEENYSYHVDEVARTFEKLFNETYVLFELEERDIFARLVSINLEKRFSEFSEKNKILVLMSGTIHSDTVLKNVFGMKKFKIIQAEEKMPGTIIKQRTGLEFSCSYENFKKPGSRKRFLQALDKCVKLAKKPCLVHVVAFNDLPTNHEASLYNLDIKTQEQLKEEQRQDKLGKRIQDFKEGKIPVLYSTRCTRGVDFPGEMCNSIVLTRYPYPNVSSLFWQILKKTKPEYFTELYMDKAKREFLQRIYRALRSQNDQVYLLSPDLRVLMARL